jgi:hypothetical protein
MIITYGDETNNVMLVTFQNEFPFARTGAFSFPCTPWDEWEEELERRPFDWHPIILAGGLHVDRFGQINTFDCLSAHHPTLPCIWTGFVRSQRTPTTREGCSVRRSTNQRIMNRRWVERVANIPHPPPRR